MSVVHPYQPMHSQHVASEAEVQAMNEKLARRVSEVAAAPAKPFVQPSEAGESRNEKAALEWNKPASKTDTAVKTKCGTYCCSKVTVMGVSYYELWRLVPERKQIAKRLDNFPQAQELARQDWVRS